MIKKSSIDKVVAQADIVEVVGQFLDLKKRGGNYLALCPFHNEKTPSFNVNPARGIYKCFGCGKGGDTLSFIREYEKFSFVEAIRWLAEFYQIELEETEDSQEQKELRQVEESLRIVNEFASQYFHEIMKHDAQGQLIGKSYFHERGFTDATLETFRLGYCLDEWETFTQTALKKGYSREILEKAGLTKVRNNKAYDNYKGRIIFPIFSQSGKVIGFGARVLKKTERVPKYINTPENELYVKNKVLYGLYQSRQAIHKEDECFLVEGYTDVISLYQGGIQNVVASSGTSLTEGQLRLIAGLTKNLTILYDGDAAGIKAALRGLDMALERSFRINLVLLPEGEDPDGFMQKNGVGYFRDYIEEHRLDFISFYLELGLKEVQNDPIKKSQLLNDMAATISKINKTEDFILRSHYIKQCSEKLDIDEEGMTNLVNKYIREGNKQIRKSEERLQKEIQQQEALQSLPEEVLESLTPEKKEAYALIHSEQSNIEWHLMELLLKYGSKEFEEGMTITNYLMHNIEPQIFQEPLVREMVLDFMNYYKEHGKEPEPSFFYRHEKETIRHKAVDMMYEKYEPNKDWVERFQIEVPYGKDIYKEELKSTLNYLTLKFIRQNLLANQEQMKDEKDPERITMLTMTHMALKEKEKQLMKLVIMK